MLSGICSDETSAPVITLAPVAVEPSPQDQGSYAQILKSSALIGGSSVLNIGIGVVRTKVMALLLGPAGFGLFGIYGSLIDLSQNIAGMGVNSSGVRQIAEAVGTGDSERIALTATVLRRISVVLGVVGAVLLAVFSRPISLLTFGSRHYAGAICILSLAVCFRLVSAGQGALIQGIRQIADLAKMGVLGALFGTIASIPIVYFFREKGIVPSLVAVAAMTVVTSWWYSRKIRVHRPVLSTSQVGMETAALLKLGFAFMSSGFMTMGVAYAVRIAVLRRVGFEATGLYQAAWTLGGLYVGFILQAMGADFYPRLTAEANNHAACNQLVNEQARVGLLLAGPGVVATLTFAPLVLGLFYSTRFDGAVELLRWICLGATLQVITWPMGFIILAKGKSGLFFICESAWTIVAVALAWSCVRLFNLNGAGIAFFGSYIFHGVLIYPIVRRLTGFRWSRENWRTILLFLFCIATVFCGFYFLPGYWPVIVGSCVFGFVTVHSIRVIASLVAVASLPSPLRRLLVRSEEIFRFQVAK